MAQLRVIIIDDDRNRREDVKRLLPDYMDTVALGAADGAIDYLKRGDDGTLPDLVILNGDDPKHFGLYVFDWMVNKSGDDDIASIPVIVLTEDEFSDRCLEFLEIGDVMFYEGEIDEGSLFEAVTDRMEEADFKPEPAEPSYEETKSLDRLIGHSVQAPEGGQRAIVLDMDTRLRNLEAALMRGSRRVNEIRTLLNAAQKAKNGKTETVLRHDRKRHARDEASMAKMSSFLIKARERAEAESSINSLRQKAIGNPEGAFNAQGTVRMEERPKSAAHDVEEKKTVVIVDDDLKTRKLCALFLTQKYNVIALDSGIKTVDYFVRGRADLLIINPVLRGMSGLSTVSSLRMHPGGAELPVMFIVGENFTGDRSRLLGRNIVGILNKPVKQGVIAQAVDGFFDSSGRTLR